MRIGYAKLGRNMKFDRGKFGFQGDPEAPQLLERLARRNPDVEWVIIGKNDCATDYLPGNVTNAWRPDVPRAPFVHADSAHRCAFCKTHAPHGFEFTCCEKGKYAWAYQQYVVALAAGLDGFVIHLGQHGNTHSPIPPANKTWDSGELTNTYAWARNYGRYLVEGINAAGDRTEGRVPVVWLCADPRNYLKARDVKWPSGAESIAAQYAFERDWKHDRFLDPRSPNDFNPPFSRSKQARKGELWITRTTYRYAGVELSILPDDWDTWGKRDFNERDPAGVATTAYWTQLGNEVRRSWLVRRYLLESFNDAKIYGKWDDRSLEEIHPFVVERNKPAEFADLLGSFRVTIALPPASLKTQDTRWVTAKPWQCFAARTVCFFVGPADAQGWIVPARKPAPDNRSECVQVAEGLWSHRVDWTDEELHLARWLRVETPDEFHARAHAAATSRETWGWLVDVQRRLLERRWKEQLLENTIEDRLGLTQAYEEQLA